SRCIARFSLPSTGIVNTDFRHSARFPSLIKQAIRLATPNLIEFMNQIIETSSLLRGETGDSHGQSGDGVRVDVLLQRGESLYERSLTAKIFVYRVLKRVRHWTAPPNESRLSCGARTKNSFHNLRAPSASSAC